VLVVHATCQSSVVYSLADDADGLFSIDPSSGVVFTTVPLDFELASVHNLSVHATNIAGAVSVASVVVHVLDVNDNRPVFAARSDRHRVLSDKKRKKKISHIHLGPLHGSSSPFFGALIQRGLNLNPIKLAYNPSQSDGWL